MILESARNHCLAKYNQSRKNHAKHRIFKIILLCSRMTKQQNCEDIVAKRCVVAIVVVVVVVVVAIVFVFVIIIIVVVVVVVVINLFCCH